MEHYTALQIELADLALGQTKEGRAWVNKVNTMNRSAKGIGKRITALMLEAENSFLN